MKHTFTHLKPEKKLRIVNASLEEFAVSGYERTNLDTIVRRAGISKGGLYEYIESKEGLFQYLLEYSYTEMYRYIMNHAEACSIPTDPLVRSRYIASVAVDFYTDNPQIITFLARASRTEQGDIMHRAQSAFDRYFESLYEGCIFDQFRFEKAELFSLLKWLLVKTRNDFTENVRSTGRPALCRDAYLTEWNFFISALTEGVYRLPLSQASGTSELLTKEKKARDCL